MFVKNIGCFVVGLCLISLALANTSNILTGRIVGGELTTISKVPYLVQIWVNDKFSCGGTLISQYFVVSAAHCFEGILPAHILVVGGATKLSDKGVRSKVQKLFVPTAYSKRTMNMDVAVLKLAQGITGTNTRTLALYTGALNTGTQVQVSGWGRTSEGGSVSNQVRTVTMPISDKRQCTRQYASLAALTDNMFCASSPGTKDSCSGDSGGPVVCSGKLCGIVSFGAGCARKDYPGVYTNTNAKAVKSFIEACLQR